jgi:hypothetical protein
MLKKILLENLKGREQAKEAGIHESRMLEWI